MALANEELSMLTLQAPTTKSLSKFCILRAACNEPSACYRCESCKRQVNEIKSRRTKADLRSKAEYVKFER